MTDMNSESIDQSSPYNLTELRTPDSAALQSDLIGEVEFAENQEPRCPCALLLDTSGSMEGEPIAALNAGLREFRSDIIGDPVALKRVEVAVITFDNTVRLVQDFVTPDRFEPPVLTAQGLTHMGAALHTVLDMVEQRKIRYKEAGIAYYRPWILMITDGDPLGEIPGFVEDAIRRMRRDVFTDKIVFFTVAVEGTDTIQLARMGFDSVLKLDGLKFNELFVWLSRSMQAATKRTGGKFSFLPTPWSKK